MPKPVSEEYAELMHYTTASGLTGIVSNGALWATHAAFLNDAEEMKHFFDARLLDIVLAEVRKYAEELALDPGTAEKMKANGGVEEIARLEAEGLVGRLRSATLKLNQPHIFSMSATHDSRVQHSGLLSQWRGYGSDGGYSIVFDTLEFERLLSLEAEAFHYQHVQWGDVYYYGIETSQPSSEDVAVLEEVVRSGTASIIRGGEADESGSFYQAISSLSCLYKHWGFWEEHEVRVIVIPSAAAVAELVAANGENKLQKPMNTFIRGGQPVPYVELFAVAEPHQLHTRLPIKRVIVGPHRDSVVRAQAVQLLLTSHGYDSEVVCSQIPYIGD